MVNTAVPDRRSRMISQVFGARSAMKLLDAAGVATASAMPGTLPQSSWMPGQTTR